MNRTVSISRGLSRLILAASASLMASAAMAQHHPIPGRMPGDVPYAHEYGTRALTQPMIPMPPPPPTPILRPMRPPEQAEGFQPVRPAPPMGVRNPGRQTVPPDRTLRIDVPSRGKLIDVEGPRIMER
ncbi:MAG: hypothetical protein ACRDBL_05875 [Rhabdaerophilum sp.]